MNKPFLLTAGSQYYPSAGDRDWVGCYETYEEAKNQIENEPYLIGSNLYNRFSIKQNNTQVDWYEIVDLRTWTE